MWKKQCFCRAVHIFPLFSLPRSFPVASVCRAQIGVAGTLLNFNAGALPLQVRRAGVAAGSTQRESFACSRCPRSFYTATGLKLHEDLHIGRYRYTCPYCGKGFSGTTNLRGHIVQHTGVREFRCALCDREYIYARDLRQHEAVCAVGGRAVRDGTSEGTTRRLEAPSQKH